LAEFEPWSAARGAAIIAAEAGREGAALPILHALQAEFGHVPKDAIPMIAAALNITRAEMHGIVTFYHDFRDHPPGRHVLRLCRAEACQSLGADALGRLDAARVAAELAAAPWDAPGDARWDAT
jgi:formate dehydrogenase subunit gamma